MERSSRKQLPAIVLAAGASRRWGIDDKLCHAVEGVPMLRRVCDALRRGGVAHLWIVHRPTQREDLGAALGNLTNFSWVSNPEAERGLGTSVRAGVAALSEDAPGFFLCPGDLPWLEAEAVSAVVASFLEGEAKSPVIPTHHGFPGHPVCLPWSWRGRVAHLPDDHGASILWKNASEPVNRLELPFSGIRRDLDSPSFGAEVEHSTESFDRREGAD